VPGGGGDLISTMRIWQGATPDGYSILIERDARQRWVVTVAMASRSRSDSLETALLEAGGSSVSSRWASRLAISITAAVSEGRTRGSEEIPRAMSRSASWAASSAAHPEPTTKRTARTTRGSSSRSNSTGGGLSGARPTGEIDDVSCELHGHQHKSHPPSQRLGGE
jgi:hypothetical protein